MNQSSGYLSFIAFRAGLGLAATLALLGACSSSSGNSTPEIVLPPSNVTIVENSPANGAQNVPASTPISVRFSSPVDTATVDEANFSLWLGTNQIAGDVQCDGIGARFFPASGLASNSPYQARIAAGIRDVQGRQIDREFSWTFSTGDSTPPRLISAIPNDGATHVALHPTIELEFSEPLASSAFEPSRFSLQSPSAAASILVSGNQNRITIVPTQDLDQEQDYVLIPQPGIVDLSQNEVIPFQVGFRTTEIVPPTVLTFSPPNNAENVAVNTPIRLRLSDDTDVASLIVENFDLRNIASTQPIPFRITVVPPATPGEGIEVTIIPIDSSTSVDINLPNGAIIEFVARTGIRDLANNHLATEFQSRFETESAVLGNPQKLENADTANPNSDVSDLRVVVAPNGSACAAWIQQTTTSPLATKFTYASVYSESSPGQWTWSDPVPLSGSTGNTSSSPQVAMIPPTPSFSTGAFLVVFEKNAPTGGVRQLYSILYIPGTGWQSAPTQVTTTGMATTPISIFDPQIAVNEVTSSYYVSWVFRYSGTRAKVMGCGYAFNGTSYDAQPIEDISFTPITGDTRSADSPRLVFDAGNDTVYAAWRERPTTSGKYSVRMSAKTWDSLGTYGPWATSILLENDDSNDVTLGNIAFDTRTAKVFAVWRQKAPTTSTTLFGDGFQSVYWDALQYTNGSWSAPMLTPTTPPLDTRTDRDVTGVPRIAIDSHLVAGTARGTALAIWEYAAPTGTSDSKIASNFYTPGSGWGTQEADFDPANGNVMRLPLVVNSEDGKFYAAWKQQEVAGKFLLFGNRFDQTTQTWGTPERLENIFSSGTTTVVEDSDLLQLASNTNGQHAVVWIKTQGTGADTRKNAWGNRFP